MQQAGTRPCGSGAHRILLKPGAKRASTDGTQLATGILSERDIRTVIEYDTLIVATGARQSYFGRPEFADEALGMKTLDDALELRGHAIGAW